MRSKTSCITKTDIYTNITNEIISAIETGATDFEMPWHRQAHAGLPRNPATKNLYRGINALTLWIIRRKEGFASSYWASYLQWKSLGAQVRHGEKGSTVIFYKRKEEDENSEEDTSNQARAVIRYSSVFNGDQVDDWSIEEESCEANHKKYVKAVGFINSLRSDIRHGSDTAYYSPALDCIFMPNQTVFRDTNSGSAVEGYYAVLFHEHIHWSGHPSRLKRDLSGRFGSSNYAMEELVAELGASFLCATLGINTYPRSDHAAYIASWIKVLKEHKSAIFVAASAASVASQFLEAMSKQSSIEKTA
ncbi:MAG: zincin-like metallopeptidase domain-containing protein [Nitrosomonas sp.]|uniref:ArdC family protein n=1 Tax=Nitrosomonas sp. TaxID=42353 RepID=UPI002730FFB3|nr:zincin-like metallopeptidase domain-containing protein [Nitrosomonas sp.]MDP1549301.1 zincin-like metallopeptidase domain-containing protein [Nitrosomonas sp.]